MHELCSGGAVGGYTIDILVAGDRVVDIDVDGVVDIDRVGCRSRTEQPTRTGYARETR